MCKFYEAPEIEIRNYSITHDVFTNSTPEHGGSLHDGDEIIINPPGGNGNGNYFGG